MMRSAVLLCLVCAISATTVSIFPLEAVQNSFNANANKTCAARNEISFEAEWTQTCTSETTVNNTVEECIEPKQPLVLYFLLDSSDSVQRSEWKSGLLWVNHIVTSTYQRQKVMALQDKIGVVIIQVSDNTRIEWANYYEENTMDDFNKMLAYLADEKFDMGSNVFHGFETAKSLVRNATNVEQMRVHAKGMGERVKVSKQAGFAAFDDKMELKQYSYDPIKIADEGALQQIYQHENGQTATCKAATEWLRPDGNSADCVFDVAANTFSDDNPNCANIVFSGTKLAQTVLYIVTDGDVIDDTDVDSAEVFDYRTTIVHGCDKNGRDRSIDALMALRQTSMVMYMCSASKRDVKISELDDQLKKQNRVMDSTKKVCAVDIVVMYENLNCCCNKEEDAVQKFAKAKRQLKVAMERFIKADKDYQYEFNIALISFNENVKIK